LFGGIVGFPILLSDPLIATVFGLASIPETASDGLPIAGAILGPACQVIAGKANF
jgi:hypothetical protein